MNFYEKIGQRIRMIRIYAGHKQKELAKQLEIQPALLSMYEQGKREQPLKFLVSFCDVYNMSLTQFFSLIEESEKESQNSALDNLILKLNSTLSSLEKMQLATPSSE